MPPIRPSQFGLHRSFLTPSAQCSVMCREADQELHRLERPAREWKIREGRTALPSPGWPLHPPREQLSLQQVKSRDWRKMERQEGGREGGT